MSPPRWVVVQHIDSCVTAKLLNSKYCGCNSSEDLFSSDVRLNAVAEVVTASILTNLIRNPFMLPFTA